MPPVGVKPPVTPTRVALDALFRKAVHDRSRPVSPVKYAIIAPGYVVNRRCRAGEKYEWDNLAYESAHAATVKHTQLVGIVKTALVKPMTPPRYDYTATEVGEE